MGKIIGIDLGIMNFCVVVMEGNEFVVIFNDEGRRIMFFVVVFMDNGERKIGDFVKCQVIINLMCIIFFIKCFMGMCFFEVLNEVGRIVYKVVKGDNDIVRVDIEG